MTRRVFLHIGAPKSGTSYLQDRFALNRDLIARQGLTFPQTKEGHHFYPALDLIQRPWAGELEAAAGSWDALVAEASRTGGDVLVSHEILAAATPEQVARAKRSFAEDEVHIIYTARDLARQLPAEWQEMVKHQSPLSFRLFMDKVQESEPGESDFWFWRVQSLPDVLTRWGAGLEPAQIHLVTVPRKTAPKGQLWERFCSVVGLDPSLDYEDSDDLNATLGAAEVAVVRRLNRALRVKGLSRPTYVDLVRELIVREVLAQRDSTRVRLPRKWREYVDEIAEGWMEWIEGSGVDVVGAREELMPVWGKRPIRHPDRPDPEDVAEAAISALAAVLLEVDRKPLDSTLRDWVGRRRG